MIVGVVVVCCRVGRGTTSWENGNCAEAIGMRMSAASDAAVPEGHDVRPDVEGTHVGLAIMD